MRVGAVGARLLANPRVADAVAEARRQTSARRTLDRSARPGYVVARVRRVPVLARLDPGLVLEHHQTRVAEAVRSVLRETAALWWELPTPSQAPLVGVDVADRRRLLEALRARLGPAGYADVLDATGRPEQRRLRVERGLPAEPRGLLVWEYATPAPGSTFVADERQGTTIVFFEPTSPGEPDPGRPVLVALAANPSCTLLERPAPAAAGEVPGPLRVPLAAATPFPIDVVYTWVDGDDETWLRRKAEAYGVADAAAFTERAHDESRWADHDELRYSLRSLEQFAPWVNHVWVVTAGQHPAWLATDHPWVSVVDHADIWPDPAGLPTFNSHAIETCLHRIPGLAEHFVYLNDDMLLGRPVRSDLFFHPNGVGKVFSSNALVDFLPARAGDIASSTAAKNARRFLTEHEGVTFTRKFFHTGAALTVSGLTELERLAGEVVRRTRRAQFRTLEDVALAGSFYLNWAQVTGRSVAGQIRYTYIDPAAPDAAARLDLLARRRVFDAFCVNDGSTDQTPEERQRSDRLIRDFFAGYLPVPGSFEVA